MTEPGKYIVFEGGESVGKSTQIDRLARALPALATYEPGGDRFGAVLRSIALDVTVERVNPLTDVYLMAAQRAELLPSTIEPALNRGQHVVCDRSVISSLAYQGAQGIDLDVIRAINAPALEGRPQPDMVVLLDADPLETARRRQGPGDYFERKDLGYHCMVREIFLHVGAEVDAVVVDALQPLDTVTTQIRNAVHERLGI